MKNMRITVNRDQLNESDKRDKIIIKFLDCFGGCQCRHLHGEQFPSPRKIDEIRGTRRDGEITFSYK
ncbi:hypothetical protein PRIPAC_73628 [Pristionchus pacificus]|uniref:Uncharacterized protein n=1 Tax=Pristionchus pacificus TaxID=54126 RepID=A0A2A6C081_PRIPA|nr:hypothetical protein PRIPAC_73628 [Pristionchus pacificus]|eukprot:PDM71519.1 hypothetical protein PRIPAC_37926 [Pristionchus pacificus]